jgi:hypothetical protein
MGYARTPDGVEKDGALKVTQSGSEHAVAGVGSGAHTKETVVKARAFRVAMVLSSIAMLLEVLGAGKKWG